MLESPDRKAAARATVDAINQSWLEGRSEDLQSLFHPALAMVYPGFVAFAVGAGSVLRGFEEFTSSSTVESSSFTDWQVHTADDTAVVSFLFELIYERHGERHRSTGRDLWVLSFAGESPRAVWRTMLDVHDEPLQV